MSNPLPLPLNEPGPLLAYIETVNRLDADTAKKIINAVRNVLKTPDGAIMLDLLEKSVLFRLTSISDDGRALAASNAQAFISSDLKRIMGNESDQILDRPDDAPNGRHLSGRRPAGRAGNAGST